MFIVNIPDLVVPWILSRHSIVKLTRCTMLFWCRTACWARCALGSLAAVRCCLSVLQGAEQRVECVVIIVDSYDFNYSLLSSADFVCEKF